MDEQEANAKLVLGTIYILLGMGLISMCINLMQEKIVSQVMCTTVCSTEEESVRREVKSRRSWLGDGICSIPCRNRAIAPG